MKNKYNISLSWCHWGRS